MSVYRDKEAGGGGEATPARGGKDARPGAETFVPIAIIGSGFSGLGMAIRLREVGIDDFLIFEKADEVGGTWRDNTYPGCACDVPSHLYSFSFAPKSDWTHHYARQPEIFSYLRECADRYGLRPFLRTGKKLISARFDDASDTWQLRFSDGSRVRARCVVSGMGGLHLPLVPKLPGRESFSGEAFHSAEWDHSVDLRGKRVAVIGTGASAIQFIPEIADRVASLEVFQRTAPWVVPRADRVLSALEHRLFARFPALQTALRARLYASHEARALAFNLSPGLLRMAQRLAKVFIRRQIRDPELRKLVTPDYTMGCKRVLISSDYYRTLNRDKVSVVAGGAQAFYPEGLLDADGNKHPADVVIYGTGFRVQDFIERDTFVGRGGVDILDSWPEGPEAFLGITVANFPNLFFLMGPNTGLGHNSMVYMIESQVAYVRSAIQTMRERDLSRLEVKAERQDAFNRQLRGKLQKTVWASGCQSWYVNEHGRNTTIWPDFTFRYRQRTRRLRLDDYEYEQQDHNA